MELGAAALAERLENNGSFGVLRVVAGHEHFYFGGHVLVDVGDLGSLIAGVHQIRAVQHVGHGAVRLVPLAE